MKNKHREELMKSDSTRSKRASDVDVGKVPE